MQPNQIDQKDARLLFLRIVRVGFIPLGIIVSRPFLGPRTHGTVQQDESV